MNYMLKKSNTDRKFCIVPSENTFQFNIAMQKDYLTSNRDNIGWTSCGKITNKYIVYHYVMTLHNSPNKNVFHLNQTKEFVKANNLLYPINFASANLELKNDNVQVLCKASDDIKFFTKPENTYYLQEGSIDVGTWHFNFQFLIVEEVPFLCKSQIEPWCLNTNCKMPELTMKRHTLMLHDLYEEAYSYYLNLKIQRLFQEKQHKFTTCKFMIG